MKTLFASDFDGCWNALDTYPEWIGEGQPTDLDYAMMSPDRWKVGYYDIDPEMYFGYDQKATVDFFNGRRIPIHWSSVLVEEINKLVDDDLITFTWLTAWKRLGVEVLSPAMNLAVGKCDWMDWNPRYRGDYSHIGKYDAIRNFYKDLEAEGNEKPALIWLEDMSSEAYADEEGQKMLREQIGADVLVIKPDERYGMSRADLTAIKDFVATH